MENKPIKLPELKELKELLKDTKNIAFYKRANIEGSKESIKYLNQKIKELNQLLNTDEDRDEKTSSL
jgi:hypothetical protein